MIENHSKISLYAQYAASIREKIERGEIKPGNRLPSILNAAEEAALSPGTIKQAYKVLTEEGYVTMIQGRGTIVLDTKRAAQQREPSGTLVTSNQARAEKAIDRLFQDLGRMGFSFSDIRILLDLKYRKLAHETASLTIGIIDCNPEARHMIADQIAEFNESDIFEYGLETILSFPDRLPDDLNLVFTTTTHESSINEAIEGRVKVYALALSPTAETISAIAKLNPTDKIALVALSHEFIGIMLKAMHKYSDIQSKPDVIHLSAETNLPISGSETYDAIIVPSNYERFSSKAEKEKIREFEQAGGKVIRFEYQMDHGSMLFAKNLIESTEIQLQKAAVG